MVKAKSVHEIVGHQNLAQLAASANYSAATLANMWGVTPRTIRRYFRGEYGVSPQSCLHNLRDMEAQKLIKQGMRKKDIAVRLGYKHASHLSRRLKKIRLQSIPEPNIFIPSFSKNHGAKTKSGAVRQS